MSLKKTVFLGGGGVAGRDHRAPCLAQPRPLPAGPGLRTGVQGRVHPLEGKAHFEDYADPSFVKEDAKIEGWTFDDPVSREQAREKGLIR